MNTGRDHSLCFDRNFEMNSHSDSRSRLTLKNSSLSLSLSLGSAAAGFAAVDLSGDGASSSVIVRLKPVPTGSTKTRSVNASQVDSLSTSREGGGSSVPSGANRTRRGPSAPTWRKAEAAPGPPLKTKVTGRFAAVSTSASSSFR